MGWPSESMSAISTPASRSLVSSSLAPSVKSFATPSWPKPWAQRANCPWTEFLACLSLVRAEPCGGEPAAIWSAAFCGSRIMNCRPAIARTCVVVVGCFATQPTGGSVTTLRPAESVLPAASSFSENFPQNSPFHSAAECCDSTRAIPFSFAKAPTNNSYNCPQFKRLSTLIGSISASSCSATITLSLERQLEFPSRSQRRGGPFCGA